MAMFKFGSKVQIDKKQERHRLVQRGATMVEYALIVAAIALVAYVGAQLLGININSLLNRTATTVGT
jgi:Flp pilus assembly pilin Flp